MKNLFFIAVLFITICFYCANTAQANEVVYKGVKKCKTCHLKIYKTWKESKHATTFQRLTPEEQKNPECVFCHSTNSDLPGVQCEACHGAGGSFSSAKIMNKKKYKVDSEKQRALAIDAGLVIAPDESNCLQCHNEKSPHYQGFDFEKRYEEIKHKKK